MINEDKYISDAIDFALREDIGEGDISTSNILPAHRQVKALLTAKSDGIISGLEIARRVFTHIDEEVFWQAFVKDGDAVKKGDDLVHLEGSYVTLLKCERTALNYLQRMSGIATTTAAFVAAAAGRCQILDTRKTAPGLRLFDKIAVRQGGGTNHRMGLYDMVMLKDNHIKAAGGIRAAVEAVRRVVPLSVKVEVETSTPEEVNEALSAGADIIMLDNMSTDLIRQAVKVINGRAKVEASGNMSIFRIDEVAATGVDYISVGALTHSVTALDISMNFVK